MWYWYSFACVLNVLERFSTRYHGEMLNDRIELFDVVRSIGQFFDLSGFHYAQKSQGVAEQGIVKFNA